MQVVYDTFDMVDDSGNIYLTRDFYYCDANPSCPNCDKPIIIMLHGNLLSASMFFKNKYVGPNVGCTISNPSIIDNENPDILMASHA